MRVILNPATMDYVESDNVRRHWSRRYQVQGYWRGLTMALVPKQKHPYERAIVTVIFRWPDRRRRDSHNYMKLVVKPIVDGLVQRNVVRDDSDKHIASLTVMAEKNTGPFRITVEVVPDERHVPVHERTPAEGGSPEQSAGRHP